MFLDKIGSGKCEIKLYYLVQTLAGLLFYNFLFQARFQNVRVEFNARIQQVTGGELG